MDGILLVMKPPGMTSFDVVAWLRNLTRIKKIGHAGTLDPSACGLIPVCFGKGTKAIEYFQRFDKSYRAEMVLGITTNSQDGDGEIIEESSIRPDMDTIIGVLKGFNGEYEQVPPMFSAVKINGKRLYELARKGIEVERRGRKVSINNLKLLYSKIDIKNPVLRFDVSCSKGTYIRTLCHDIGQKLGCGAYMSFLVRTQVGPFSLYEGSTLEEIKKYCLEGSLSSALKPTDTLFMDYPAIVFDKNTAKKYMNGLSVGYMGDEEISSVGNVRVYIETGLFLGIGSVSFDNGNVIIKSKKLLTRYP